MPVARAGWWREITVTEWSMVAVAASVCGHLLLRGTDWQREWLWLFDAYHFSTIILGPLTAAVGTVVGAELAGLRRHIRWSPVAYTFVLRSIVGRTVPIVSLYVCGLLVAAVFAVGRGLDPAAGLDGRILATTLPALGLLGAAMSLGVAVGFLVGRSVAAVGVHICTQLAMISLYSRNLPPGSRIGGANTTLVGLVRPVDLIAAQFALFAVFGLVVAVVVTARTADRRYSTFVWTGAGAVIGLGLLVTALSEDGSRFAEVPVSLECSDDHGLEVCLVEEYAAARASVISQLLPQVDRAAMLGLGRLDAVSQHPSGPGTLLPYQYIVDAERHPEIAASLLIAHYTGDTDRCAINRTVSRDQAIVVQWFLFPVFGDLGDPAVPSSHAEAPDSASTRRSVAESIGRLRAC